MMYKCNHCGRKFKEKCAHNCNTGFRKRHLSWDVTDLDLGDFMRLKSMRLIVEREMMQMFGKNATLRDVSNELGIIIGKYVE